MKIVSLEKLSEFIELTNEFQKIMRKSYIPGTSEYENDAAHTFQLAIVAFYMLSVSNERNLDINKVIKYALIHDLVETYAGDISAHSQTEEVKAKKEKDEKAAFIKIMKKFPEFIEYDNLYKEYEAKIDAESKFVYCLDKLIPVISSIESKGMSWKEQNVTFESLVSVKEDKIKMDREVFDLWLEVKAVLRNKPELFTEQGR